jgi:hypothetical protein
MSRRSAKEIEACAHSLNTPPRGPSIGCPGLTCTPTSYSRSNKPECRLNRPQPACYGRTPRHQKRDDSQRVRDHKGAGFLSGLSCFSRHNDTLTSAFAVASEGFDSPTEPHPQRAVARRNRVLERRAAADCSAGAHEEFSELACTNAKPPLAQGVCIRGK